MTTTPEFSFFVDCNALKEAEKTYEIEASEAERKALAERFDLLNLDVLKAHAVVSRKSGDLVHLECDLIAELTQECVVTFKPLKKQYNSTFERTFSVSVEPYYGSEKEPEGEGEYVDSSLNDDVPEPPDPMTDGGFDLGETVAEQLSLEIDPFPRSDDADFDGYSSLGAEEENDGKTSPFAVLEQLKKNT